MSDRCYHGANVGPDSRPYSDALRELHEILNQAPENNLEAHASLFINFWKSPHYSHLVGDELVKMYFWLGTNWLLRGGTKNARGFAFYGMLIEDMTRVGVETFKNDLAFQKGSIELASRKFSSVYLTTRFLAKKIPCSCLDAIKRQAKNGPKLEWCKVCIKNFPIGDMNECGRCRVPRYCSRECQVADWGNHRQYCRAWRDMRNTEG